MKQLLGTLISTFFVLSSCSSDLNFNQVKEIRLEPVAALNLASFDIPANQFVIGGIEQTVLGEVLNFDAFRNSYINKSLVKAELYFEVNNTIERVFQINLYLLDANDAPLYTIIIDVPAYIGVENLITKIELFDGAKLDMLKNTKKIGFTITIPPGIPALSASSLGSLKLRSSGTAYFIIP